MGRPLRTLLVDDDAGFRRFSTIAFEEAGLAVETAEDGAQGLELLAQRPRGHFDLIFLDLDMPRTTGWELLMEVRARGSEVPIIIVSGSADGMQDRVRALRLGADDVLSKPVEYEELIARAEAVVRRRNSLPVFDHGDVSIDLAHRKVTRAGESIELSPREFDVLLNLAQARGEIVSRERLLREVWDLDFDPETNVVEVHIMRIRKRLAHAGPPILENVRGQGYRLLGGEALESGD